MKIPQVKVTHDDNGIPVEEGIWKCVVVIGKTRSGRNIYMDSYDITHAFYDYEDHIDAEALHKVKRNEAFIRDKKPDRQAEMDHHYHAFQHKKAGLFWTCVDDKFERACLDHNEKVHRQMSRLKARAS